MTKANLADLTADDILEDPKAFGMPTFEEFTKNREKYLGRDEESLEQVDKGGINVRKVTQRHIYEIEGYRCKTLEEVQKVAGSMGIDLKKLDYRPQFIPCGAGKWDLKVVFVSKDRRLREVVR